MTFLRAALAVAGKELSTSFRDRMTVLYTFVLPVCMYPVLFWVMIQGVLVVQGQKGAKDVTLGLVATAEQVEAAEQALADEVPEEGGLQAALGSTGRVELEVGAPQLLAGGTLDEDGVRAWMLAEGGPHAILALPPDRTADEARARLFFDGTDNRSKIARDRAKERLRTWADELREETARELDVDPEALEPILVERHDVATEADQGALALSLILPMMLVIMAFMGAFFPAVDLTAGEKERRTVETTMLLPVPRGAVHVGKILAVSSTSIIAAALNLLALGLAAGHLIGMLEAESVQINLPVGTLLAITPLAALFCFFISAVLTGLAGMAATFKEGQALLGPTQILFIFPALASSVPGLGLTYGTALIPVVNVALAFREMLVGTVDAGPLLVCALALFAYAMVAILLSVRLLSRESVALSGETIPLMRLLSTMRSSGGTK